MPGLVATPLAVLSAGALALLLLNRIAGPRNRSPVTLLAIGVASLALLSLARYLPAKATISRWHPFFGSDLAYHVDGLAFLFAALMALVALAASAPGLGRPEYPEGTSYASLLALLAAGLSFVFSANLITLCLSWVVFDLVFLWAFIRLRITHYVLRILNLSCLACLSLLAAALLVGDSSLSFRSDSLSAPALGLILLAALIRIGLYPLHLWIPIGVKASPAARSLLHLIPATAGLYLLARVSAWADGELLWQLPPQAWGGLRWDAGPALGIAGGLAFFVGALLAWMEADLGRTLSLVMIGQVGCIITSSAIVEPRAMVVLSSLNLILCLSLLFLSQDRAEPGGLWARAASALGVASLAGVPLTSGFVARWHIYHSLLTGSHWALLALTLSAEALLFAALLRMWSVVCANTSPSASVHERLPIVGAALLALPVVILGLHPAVLSPFMERASFPTLLDLLRSTTIGQWAALFLPLVGGYLLHRHRQRIFDPHESLWLRLMTFLRLEWLYGIIGQTIDVVASALRIVGNLIAGRGYLGWVAVVGLLAYLFLRSG